MLCLQKICTNEEKIAMASNWDWLNNISTPSTSDNSVLAEQDAVKDGANEEQNDGLQYDPTNNSGSSDNSSNNNGNDSSNDNDGGTTTSGNVTLNN